MQSDFPPPVFDSRQDRGGILGDVHISQAPDCLSFEASPSGFCLRNASPSPYHASIHALSKRTPWGKNALPVSRPSALRNC